MRVLGFLILGISTSVCAQWNVGTSLELTGDSASDRQIIGVTIPVSSTSGVPASAIRDQRLQFAPVAGGSSIDITLVPAPISYDDGMLVSFTPLSAIDSAASIDVNGIGNVALLKNGGIALSSTDLRIGRPYSAIYSNGAFRLLSSSSPACPLGYEIVTRDYCIESQPSAATSWYSASILCMEKGARLCTMGEWMRACKKLDLTTTITAWEWVDSAGNSSSEAKVMGLDPVNFIDPDCEYGRTYAPLNPAQYRCCYSR